MKTFVEAPGIAVGPTISTGAALGMAKLLQHPASKFLNLPRHMYKEAELRITWVRDMEPEEAKVLLHPQKAKRPEALAGKLRARHHAIARMMVAGAKDEEICQAIGISRVTLYHLRDSPAFMALYLEYSAMADEAAIDLRMRMTAAAGLAVDEITRRLAETPETFPTKDLKEVATTLLDRVGHGPTQKVENVTAVLTLEDIRAMKSARKAQVVIEHAPDE
jgi:hypothetical protein